MTAAVRLRMTKSVSSLRRWTIKFRRLPHRMSTRTVVVRRPRAVGPALGLELGVHRDVVVTRVAHGLTARAVVGR